MHKNFLILTLKVFSATGGIEKVCRIVGKALFDHSLSGTDSFQLYSLHDSHADADDNQYFPTEYFRGFKGKRLPFIFTSMRMSKKADVIILSHINLLVVGKLIKLIFPKKKICLFAHGIEVWNISSKWKQMLLSNCDLFICVSDFTRQQLVNTYGVDINKSVVVNNCLDPFLPLPETIRPASDLRLRYGISHEDFVIFTLTRISSKERYKGYDKVLEALSRIKDSNRPLKYLLAGSCDQEEGDYIRKMIDSLGLNHRVIMPGFIEESEVADHFMISDAYIMPSLKEGFGIVFIEAMYYGLPVIAGNKDGSVDALDHGRMGQLVDPNNVNEIENAIRHLMDGRKRLVPEWHVLMEKSGFNNYKKKFIRAIAG